MHPTRFRELKEWREEEREQKERERRIEAKLPPRFDDTKSMQDELIEMIDWSMNFGPPTH